MQKHPTKNNHFLHETGEKKNVAKVYEVFFWQVNPFAPTRRKTVTHFRRLFTVFECSPIGMKFPPITAPHTLYTVKKKN